MQNKIKDREFLQIGEPEILIKNDSFEVKHYCCLIET